MQLYAFRTGTAVFVSVSQSYVPTHTRATESIGRAPETRAFPYGRDRGFAYETADSPVWEELVVVVVLRFIIITIISHVGGLGTCGQFARAYDEQPKDTSSYGRTPTNDVNKGFHRGVRDRV